jgi:hypothetical protein
MVVRIKQPADINIEPEYFVNRFAFYTGLGVFLKHLYLAAL